MIDIPVKEGHTFSGWDSIPAIMPAKDIIISGTFVINNYSLAYIIDGDTLYSGSVVYGDSLPMIDIPVKEGHTFSGWDSIPIVMPANNIILNGFFAINTYIIKYVVDGEIFVTDSIVYNSDVNVISAPAKVGHTFSGWSDVPKIMPAHDVEITGTFEKNTYAIKYVIDGKPFATDSLVYDSDITLISAPEKEGYTFSGWSYAPPKMPAENIVISGSFLVNYYAVTYIIAGDTIATDSIAYGAEITPIATPEKEGHTFSGWSEAPATMPANDIVISGSYDINTYVVTYIVDSEIYAIDSIAYDSDITLISAPEKEGYTFSGWSYAPPKMPAENIVISGSFLVNYYAVTYIIAGDTIATDSIAYGAEITPIAAPEKEGHTFSGWSEAPVTMPANDIVISGSFSVNYYTLTYIVDGDEYKVEQIAYGDSVVLIDAPVKDGYTFSGWSYAPTTMPAKDVVIMGMFINTNINAASADAIVKVNGNCITLVGAENSSVAIYSTSGALVEKIDAYAGEEITLDKGVYIVRVVGKAVKVKL